MVKLPLINHKKCTRCGRCVAVCPKKVLVLEGDKIVSVESECMLCSHCFSICPADAITFDPAVLKQPRFQTLAYLERRPNPSLIRAGDLINFMRSRRSVRKYSAKSVDDPVIADLIEFAVTAPSGSNCQEWEFTVLNGRDKVWELAMEIRKFFRKINSLAKNPVTLFLSLLGGTSLWKYRRDHMESVELALEESEKGIDLLFHGAPALVIIHSPLTGSTPAEDGILASYNICLLAHALGLGTCYIGYAVEAFNHDKNLKRFLQIPAGNKIHAVLVLGHPDIRYMRHALRKKPGVRFA